MKVLAVLLLASVAIAAALDISGAIRDLQTKVKGPVHLPGTPEYREAISVFSPRHGLRPAMVVVPADVADIQAAMVIAQQRGIPFRVGAGQHSYEGYALAQDGMLLSLRNSHWRQVSDVDADGVMTIAGGAQLIDAHRAMIPKGRGVVAGLCPSVGMVPFTLGGGYGSLSRLVGLSADQLVSLTMVLANTSVVRVSAHENTELWWALRGGGGGNLGVVTEMKLRTFALPEGQEMMMGETCWDWADHGLQVFNWWARQASSPDTDRRVTYSMRSHFGPLDMFAQDVPAEQVRQQICVQPFFFGTAAEGTAAVRRDWADLPTPVSDNSVAQSWLVDVEHEHQKVTALYGLPVYIKSGFFTQMSPALVEILHDAIATAPTVGNCIIDFDHLHGAIADVSPTATAYINRDAKINLQIIAIWTEGDERQGEYMNWANELFARVQPFMSGNYVNYIDAGLPNWQQRYYGENYARLQAVKASVDPRGFFSFPQSIRA